MDPQAGLAQVTSEGAVVFQALRRCRVLLRDNFRFGTATSLLLALAGPGARRRFVCHLV